MSTAATSSLMTRKEFLKKVGIGSLAALFFSKMSLEKVFANTTVTDNLASAGASNGYYVGNTPPSVTNKLWVNTADNKRIYYFNGNDWVIQGYAKDEDLTSEESSRKSADDALSTRITTAQSTANTANTAAGTAQTAANNAQTTANTAVNNIGKSKGNANTPVYVNSSGQIVAGTPFSNASVKYATSAGSATNATNATNATTATKLGTSDGNANTPVYFSGGKPVACGFSIEIVN